MSEDGQRGPGSDGTAHRGRPGAGQGRQNAGASWWRCRRTRCPRSPTGPRRCWPSWSLAGLPGLSYSLPVGAAIVVLMLAVGVSYRQTIRAYPQGGESYIVASEELGRVPA